MKKLFLVVLMSLLIYSPVFCAILFEEGLSGNGSNMWSSGLSVSNRSANGTVLGVSYTSVWSAYETAWGLTYTKTWE